MDDRIRSYIKSMVETHNIVSSTEMKLLIEAYLSHDLFKEKGLPDKSIRRFWPTMKDISNAIATFRKSQRHSELDQV